MAEAVVPFVKKTTAQIARLPKDEQLREQALQRLFEDTSDYADELRTIYTRMAERKNKIAENSLRGYYDHGVDTKRAADIAREAYKTVYGKEIAVGLAEALGMDASTLYKAVWLVDCYKDIDSLLERRMPSGACITWSHMAELLHIENDKARDAVLEMTFQKGLSVRSLRDEIQRRAARSGGNNPPAPRSLQGAFSQVRTVTNRAQKVFADEHRSLFAQLAQIDPEKYDSKLLEKIDEARAAIKKLKELLDVKLEFVDVVRKRLGDAPRGKDETEKTEEETNAAGSNGTPKAKKKKVRRPVET